MAPIQTQRHRAEEDSKPDKSSGFSSSPGTAAAPWAVSIMHAPGLVVCYPLQHRNVHSNGLEIITDPENKYVCVLVSRAGTIQN